MREVAAAVLKMTNHRRRHHTRSRTEEEGRTNIISAREERERLHGMSVIRLGFGLEGLVPPP